MTTDVCPTCGRRLDAPLPTRHEGRIAGVDDPERYALTLADWTEGEAPDAVQRGSAVAAELARRGATLRRRFSARGQL